MTFHEYVAAVAAELAGMMFLPPDKAQAAATLIEATEYDLDEAHGDMVAPRDAAAQILRAEANYQTSEAERRAGMS